MKQTHVTLSITNAAPDIGHRKRGTSSSSTLKKLIAKYKQDVGLADIHADGGPR